MSDPRISRMPADPIAWRPDAWAAALWAILRRWHHRRRSRLRLDALDARLLADIGLSEPTRRRECAKWFWQA